jgi:hypothetical protein
MKKIIQSVAGASALLVLAACGGGSGGSASVTEYSLADYEGRTVSAETLAGTWVAVGTGTYSYTDEDATGIENIAVKEYFVIEDTGSSLVKADCEGYGSDTISVSGNEITYGDFSGTVVDNQSISGSISSSDEWSNGISEQTDIALSIVKISDATSPFGAIAVNTTTGPLSTELSCFQQYNSVASWNGESDGAALIIEAYPMTLTSWTGTYAYTSLESTSPSAYLDTDYEGESVTFDLTSDSSLTETVTFSASDSTLSLTGTIQVQLPAQ